MKIAIKGNRDRILALSILGAMVIVVAGITVVPVWAANASRQATLDDNYERLQRYESIAARDQELLPQYKALVRKQRSAGNHLRSETSALACAELQRLAKTIAGSNGAEIMSTQLLPIGGEQGFTRVAIKVRLRGTLPAILESFHGFETSDLYLFLDNVTLRDNRVGRTRDEIRAMDAEFDLIAYMPEAT